VGIFGSEPAPERYFNARVNDSAYGKPYIWVMGTAQVQSQILWVDGFTSKKAPSKGGKGGGKGGQYIYAADVEAALCLGGTVLGIGDVWTGQSWLGSPKAAESYTIGSPYTYTVENADYFYNDLGVSTAVSVSESYDDLGAPYATVIDQITNAIFQQVASSPGAGQYSVNPETGQYTFSSLNNGVTVQVSYSYSVQTVNQQQRVVIPGSPYTVSVGDEGSGAYVSADEGVVWASGDNEGTAFTKVIGTPSASGTYSTTGTNPMVYKFYSGDTNSLVTMTWSEYEPNAVAPGEPTSLNYTNNTGAIGQSPFSYLTDSYPDAAWSYSGIFGVLYQPMDLGYSNEVQQNRFEIITSDAMGGGIQDCNPVICIGRVLTDTQAGLGVGAVPFPTAAIDNGTDGTWGGPSSVPGQNAVGATAFNWFAAQNFFISPVIDGQDTAASICGKWLEAGMCATYVSEGLLKLVPYGDTSANSNGYTWTAPSVYAAALDDTCFKPVKGKDPVKFGRTSAADAWNVTQINFDSRLNQYSTETIQESDQGLINAWGIERREDPQDCSFVHTPQAATFAGNMRIKHNGYERVTAEFGLDFTWSHLEPMDIVTITTSSLWANGANNINLGCVNRPMRITKIENDPAQGLKVTCEDYIFGSHQPTIYNKQLNVSSPITNAFANPGNPEVVMFECPTLFALAQGNVTGDTIGIGAMGTSTNYGSTNVFVSEDGTDYIPVGTIKFPAKLGTLASAFHVTSPVSDPDTTDSLVVDLATNCGTMVAATTSNADNDASLCFVDGELISYSALTYTNQQQVTMGTYIRRGQYGTTQSSHAEGSLFLLLDSSIFYYTYPPTWRGKTLYFKFQAANVFGYSPLGLDSIEAITFTIPGENPGSIDASTGILAPQYNTAIYEGAWSSSFPYVEGNIVDVSGYIYQCVLANTDEEPPNSTYWALISSPSNSVFTGAWNSGTAYAVGNQVTYDGNYYICTTANTNNIPSMSSWWQQIGTSYQFLGAYNSGTAYQVGNEVSYNGSTWICISAGTGQTPSTTSSYWTLIGTAAILLGAWSSSTAYVISNQVVYGGNIYSCIAANTNEEPDTSPSYWTIIGSQSLSSIPPTGSISPIVCNPFSYSSTSSSITISWTGQTISLVNGTSISVGTGSQTITGLAANTSYAFFPFWNTTASALQFINAADVASLQTLNGVLLNGSTGEVTTTTDIAYGSTHSFSLECWVYTETSTAAMMQLNANKTGTTSSTYGPTVWDYYSEYGFTGWTGSCLTGYSTTSIPASSINVWHHVVFSWNATGVIGNMYVDGVQYHASYNACTAASGYMRIGRGYGSSDTFSNAIMAHVAYYSTALSQTQVSNHYSTMLESGPTAYATVVEGDSPLYYWKLNEASGTTAADSVGSNTGTYTGGYTLNTGYAIGAAIGSPAIAWINPPSAVALAQYEQTNYPLSAGATGFTAATTASGSGGGIVGGFTIPGLPAGFAIN